MCLSTVYVYKVNNAEKTKLCEYISKVEERGGEYVFTDIMGEETAVRAKLRAIDLVKNEILLEDAQ